MTEIQLNDYHGEFQDHVEDKEQDGVLKPSTSDQRRYAIDELVEYFEYHDKALYTDDFYQSVDNLKQFFQGTVVHGSKVACIRAFLEYIEKQLPERESERPRDERERIKAVRVDGKSRERKVRTKQIERRF